MSLFLSEVKSEISNTLNRRQDNLDADNISWFSRKIPWVRLTSMASVDGDDNLRKNWILFGGISSGVGLKSGFQEMYDNSSGRPMPGITNVSVANKGSMGSTREATIDFTCWDLEQMNSIELLYMTTGIHLLLEWGWSTGINNEKTDFDLSIIPPQSDNEMVKKILDNVYESAGHYDAMQGPVSNFSWKLNKEGGFECSVTIVSVAEMFLELDIHSTSKNITKSLINSKIDDTEADKAIEENLKATLITTIRNIAETGRKMSDMIGFFVVIPTEKEMPDIFKKSNVSSSGAQYYVRWSYFEEYFINRNLFYKVTENGKKIISPRLDSNSLMINYDPFIISGDPGICILPLDTWGFQKFTLNGMNVIPENFIETPTETIHGKRIHFGNILINLRFVYDTYVNNKSLNDFLRTMLDGITDACGGYWDFSYQIDEDNPDIISVVEYKTIAPNEIKPFLFKVNKRNSIITDINLNTEVPGELKSIMMLGVNREEDNDSSVNKTDGQQSNNEYNFYGKNVKNLAIGKYEATKAEEQDIGKEKVKSFNEADAEWTIFDYLEVLKQDIDRVYGYSLFGSSGISEENVTNLKNSLKKYISDIVVNSEYVMPDIPSGSNPIDIWNAFQKSLAAANTKKKTSADKCFTLIPLKLSFSIDGISGLKFGNAVHIDYLPTRYLSNAFFQITNVSQAISQNEWKTTIETIMSINNNSIADGIKSDNTFRTFNNTIPEQEEVITPEAISSYETDEFHSPVPLCNEHNNRGMIKLHPDMKPMARSFINQVEDLLKISIRITIYSFGGFRTFEEQDNLFKQGRGGNPGNIITSTKGGYSYHNYGLAIDVYDHTNQKFRISQEIANIAISLGFEWGSAWDDTPHFQMTFGYSVEQLLAKYNAKDWDPDYPGYVKL